MEVYAGHCVTSSLVPVFRHDQNARESRWLVSKGRKEDALRVLKKSGTKNGQQLSCKKLNSLSKKKTSLKKRHLKIFQSHGCAVLCLLD